MHSTLYRDLERCIQAATVEGTESAQDGAEQAEEPAGYSTTGWQLERLRTAINGMMRISMDSDGEEEVAEEEPFDCGRIELNAECLRALIEAVNQSNEGEEGSAVEVPKEERTSTTHALLYELWKTLGSGALCEGKRYKGVKEACEAHSSDSATVVACQNETLSDCVTVSGDITLRGTGVTISAASSKNLFKTQTGSSRTAPSLTLEDGVELTGGTGGGNSSNQNGGVYIQSGTFTMNGGKITNCTSTSSPNYGGGVQVCSGANFNFNGGEISGCKAQYGGGIYIDQGTCTYSGGKITSCEATNGGGGIYATANANSKLVLDGCEITQCSAGQQGGGIYMNSDATLTFNNNTPDIIITGNSAKTGGGLYIGSNTNSTYDESNLAQIHGNSPEDVYRPTS